MVALDPRINPFRPEIAANHLRGHVEAKRFVEGSRHQIIEPVTMLRRTPSHDARLDTEALLGERMTIYETTDEGWAWGQLETDGYVGWLSSNALGAIGPTPTHKVAVPRAFAFAGPESQSRGRTNGSQSRLSAGISPRSTWRPSRCGSLISSPLRSGLSAHLICGEARPLSAWTARAWSRFHCRQQAFRVPVTATCRSLRSENCLRLQACAEAISCSGRTTSPLRLIPKRLFTQMPIT